MLVKRPVTPDDFARLEDERLVADQRDDDGIRSSSATGLCCRTPALRDICSTLNENAERVNRRLFSYMDYAAVAVRP